MIFSICISVMSGCNEIVFSGSFIVAPFNPDIFGPIFDFNLKSFEMSSSSCRLSLVVCHLVDQA